ncbi:MAG: translation elongation factor-like protein [Desulfarculus sp.]|nr:MAG: translation elongation factor-like protein [Desulfarculus sp.]
MVAAVFVLTGDIQVGDRLRFAGYTTDFDARVESLQEERQPINLAGPGQSVGVQVPQRARVGDRVFKIT